MLKLCYNITIKANTNKILGGKMYMKYRLKVNVCGKWIIGRVTYNSYIEAQIRQEELRLNGIESKVVDSIGGDAE